MRDLERAKELLKSDVTCSVVRGTEEHVSRLNGIAPMMGFMQENIDMRGAAAADKIVGKAAAFLFIKAGIRTVYAEVLSKPGLDVLQRFGIPVTWNTLTDRIINRSGTDICPMEKCVQEIEDPEKAYNALLQRIRQN